MTEKPPTRLDDARALKRMNIPLNTPVNTRESTRAHHPLRTQRRDIQPWRGCRRRAELPLCGRKRDRPDRAIAGEGRR